jgi:hypothetical protein
MLYQADCSPYLTHWTNYLKKSPQNVFYYINLKTPFNVKSAIQQSIFDLLNIFLAKSYSKLELSIHTCWILLTFKSKRKVHIWPSELISGQRFLKDDLTIHSDSFFFRCYISQMAVKIWTTKTYFWPKSTRHLNFLYKLVDSFWCHVRHTEFQIWPTEHITAQRILKD